MLRAMGLELIIGPPNSGRAVAIRERIERLLDREPVLVVPTGDDAARFERDLCAGRGATLGVAIRTFSSLFEDGARATALDLPPALSATQRLALVGAAIDATELRLLRRSSARPGFAPALDALISELQGALVTPLDLDLHARELDDGDYERELAALYGTYEELRERAGRSDAGSRALATIDALRARPQDWGARPVLIYGFDDLTRAQLELIASLRAVAEVVIAVNYADRDALSAHAELPAQLDHELGVDRVLELDHDPSYTDRDSLRHLDRSLFEPEAVRTEIDGAVTLLECAGELGEAEAIAAEIARLLADGEPPDSIAVVVRDPARRGPLLGRVFGRLRIPAAIEASAPLAGTAVGRSLIALCRAQASDDPAALLDHLRADPSTPPGIADRLELGIRRERPESIDQAIGRWQSPPRHLAAVRAAARGAARMQALARVARALAEAPHTQAAPLAGEVASPPGTPLDPVEQRAAVTCAELCAELAEIGALPGCEAPDLIEASEAIESATVRLWRGPAEGRVRILGPYRIRAGRARHLFCAGLQEGEFPRRSAGDPLLGEGRRAQLGIEALRRRDALDEERYLFHACVSRPTEHLYLSWQAADDEGAPAARSPFVDEVLDLLGPDPATAEAQLTRRRGLERVVFGPDEAPSSHELARAQALAGPRIAEPKPGPLAVPEVLAELERRELLSASTLERWLECPYRWFVDHELRPQRLDPESDALLLGSIAHDALHRLYSEPPGADAIPRPADLGRWRASLRELLDSAARANGMRPERPLDAIALGRLRAQIDTFLAEEAARQTPLRPRTDLLEAGFGFEDEGGGPPALDLGAAKLRGRIDRIDVAPDGAALIRDYKTGSEVSGRAGWQSRGKLQLQLYILAARERLGLDPIGGLYTALGARDDRRPRGILISEEARLEGLDTVRGDPCDREQFDAELERAREQAAGKAKAMRAGEIDRDPIGGRCPRYCSFQPICRLERAVGLDDDAYGNGGGGNGTGNGS
ncbi:MAG: ATP-dependent nuclease subunit B-like protein [Solirubrobacterales bacterium]|jgi:RecB family exonuclease/inactivated superfamily I helicase|nr:ATP-dependent nuclease subunit B-like protein [Solirubrobacterales bacterium]